MYTLIQTAKLNNVDPRAWLADALARVADTPQTDAVQAPTGYCVPTDAQKYDSPYYRGIGQNWDWFQNPIVGPFTTATLNISAFDADFTAPYPNEVDNIYAEDSGSWVLLGHLTGESAVWSYGNAFTLGSNFFDDIEAGLHVMIDIDTLDGGWIVTLGKSSLLIDGGGLPRRCQARQSRRPGR